VLLLPNTQLRVIAPVGAGVKELLTYALRCGLSRVAVVEMQKEVTSYTYSDVYSKTSKVLTGEERVKLEKILRKISHLDETKGKAIT